MRSYLQGNALSSIPSDFCAGCGSVKWIEMHASGITAIGSGFCSSCEKLQMLCASSCPRLCLSDLTVAE